MRKEVTYLFVFFIVLTLLAGCHSSGSKAPGSSSPANFDDIEPVILAIFYFDSSQEDLRNMTLDMLIAEFSTMQEFRIVEREKLDTVLEELGLSASDLADEANRLKVGKILGAHLMCFGSATESDAGVVISGRLVRTETSEIISAASSTEKDAVKSIKAFAEQMRARVRTEKNHEMLKEISESLQSS